MNITFGDSIRRLVNTPEHLTKLYTKIFKPTLFRSVYLVRPCYVSMFLININWHLTCAGLENKLVIF